MLLQITPVTPIIFLRDLVMIEALKHLNLRARREWLKAAGAASLLAMSGRLGAKIGRAHV